MAEIVVAIILLWCFGAFKKQPIDQYVNIRIPKKITIVSKKAKKGKKKKKHEPKNKVITFREPDRKPAQEPGYTGATFDNKER